MTLKPRYLIKRKTFPTEKIGEYIDELGRKVTQFAPGWAFNTEPPVAALDADPAKAKPVKHTHQYSQGRRSKWRDE